MFLNLGDIILDRAVKPEGTAGAPDLIGFADGSLEAYACAIYIRWPLQKSEPTEPDQFFVRLVCGKARVTPVKGTTVPRSELSGFLILTRLLKVVVAAMDDKPIQVLTAVDSQCTISAFEKSGGLLAPYFASQVAEAQQPCGHSRTFYCSPNSACTRPSQPGRHSYSGYLDTAGCSF